MLRDNNFIVLGLHCLAGISLLQLSGKDCGPLALHCEFVRDSVSSVSESGAGVAQSSWPASYRLRLESLCEYQALQCFSLCPGMVHARHIRGCPWRQFFAL